MEPKLKDTECMHQRLQNYCKENDLKNSQVALEFAREIYMSCKPRRDGEPYFIHPLAITLKGISLGITDDISIATELLHDVTEECPNSDLDNLPIEDEIKMYVHILTYTPVEGLSKIASQEIYYREILKYLITTRTKTLDRADNVSTMGWAFKLEKVFLYVEETYRFYPDLIQKWLEEASSITEEIRIWELERDIFTSIFSYERFLEPTGYSVNEDLKRNLKRIKIAS